MKSLEKMTFPERIVLTVIIVLVILFALALVGWTTGRWNQEAPAKDMAARGPQPSIVPPLGDSKYDEHLIELDKQTLERSYQAQVQLLFTTWLRDDIARTSGVTNGLMIARRAYIHAASLLEKRTEELEKRKAKQ